jgi:DHA1 family bicyclomycin/chloramphenicol resistance-like MFS transporter
MRRLSHTAMIALVALTSAAAVLKLVVPVFPLLLLIGFLALAFFLIGLMLPNFNAIAMEPLGHIAGTGSAFVGFAMTALGAVLGGVVGQFYDGSIRPLVLGYLVYSLVALAVVAVTERGRLMEPSPDRAAPKERTRFST